MSRPEQVIVFTDGAARGNPGPAGAGSYIESQDGSCLDEAHRYLGRATNNVAEYEALILGLERAAALGARRVEVRADSQLLVKQMLGEYRINNGSLRECAQRARELVKNFDAVNYVHIRRHLNEEADRLANLAIDQA